MKMNLSSQQWRIIRRIQRRRWPVTDGFMRANLDNVLKYLHYATIPRVTIKSGAVRRMRAVRTKERVKLLPFVFINYYMLRRVLFDKARRARIKKRRRHVAAWSRGVVEVLNRKNGVHIYEEIQQTEAERVRKHPKDEQKSSADLTQQVKEQLELLKTGKRVKLTDVGATIKKTPTVDTMLWPMVAGEQLATKTAESTVNAAVQPTEELAVKTVDETHIATSAAVDTQLASPKTADSNLLDECTGHFVTPEKQVLKTTPTFPPTIETRTSRESEITDENDELLADRRPRPMQDRKDTNANILDLILNKMAAKKQATATALEESAVQVVAAQNDLENEHTDGSDEFAGFDEIDAVAGMLDAPLVPQLARSKEGNAAFVSTSLDEFMRENALEPGIDQPSRISGQLVQRHRQASLDGLVTPYCLPPPFLAPLQPEGLQKQRTVAERRAYLQKNARNYKLAIINNECHIYRELNRKIRLHKGKSAAQEALQAPGAHMYFTRFGWQAASFVTTEFNRYYQQKLEILTKNGSITVKLPGVRGNNEEGKKPQYRNYVPKHLLPTHCLEGCLDKLISRDFRACESPAHKSKLNNLPLKQDFKPSPLRYKPLQKPADDDTAVMLLAGGGMVVVEMPTVTLEVFPEFTKTLDEVARRYLSYIQPSESVTRNWASMCASTLFPSYEEAAAAAKRGDKERKHPPEQFVFAVPYKNDRSKLLVRRVIDRSAPLLQDSYFTLPTQPSGKELDKYFTFRQTPAADADEVSVDCKEFLTDLIVSATLSCGENSLSVEDDNARSDPVVKPPEAVNSAKPNDKITPTGASKRQSRLVAELRRLNASIIDASADQSEEPTTCAKPSCRLGCICQSLATGRPQREHCGKAKCVLKCECKHANSSKVIRIDADLSGRSLTTEAAFRLRRKVTQRLAPMEKEFTSTVVLTGNETLLINESHHDRKRRCTKKPKHYDDFESQDAGLNTRQSLSPNAKNTSAGALVSIETHDDHNASTATSYSETTTELRQPIYLNESDMEKMKHCLVALPRWKDIKNMTTWCMVHGLYKCFCGGHALEGKPLTIDRENNVTMAAAAAATEKRPSYQFEMMDNEEMPATPSTNSMEFESPQHFLEDSEQSPQKSAQKSAQKRDDVDSAGESSEYDADDNDPEFKSKARYLPKWGRDERPERRGRQSQHKSKTEYANARLDTCRRCVPIPSKIYHRSNKRTLNEPSRQVIASRETAFERSLLTEHMLRSVFHYKAEKAKEKVRLAREEAASLSNDEDCVEVRSSTAEESADEAPRVEVPSHSKSAHKRASKTISPLKRAASSSQQPAKSASLLKRPLASDDSGPTLPKLRAFESNNSSVEPTSTTAIAEAPPDPDVPRITACFSLQERSEFNGVSFSNFVSFHDGMTVEDIRPIIRPSDLPEHTRENFQQFFNSVISNMNSLVSKKMHDIDMALKRDSLFIPEPHEDVLCIMRWTNFLKAYRQGGVHVWDVQQRKQKFLVATMNNVMPLVPGALGVFDVRANQLCEADFRLFSAMLLKNFYRPNIEKVAVLMQGCTRYWTIKGFLWPDATLACGKPTPETHPLLTKKINQLCGMLVAQRIREYQQKHKMRANTPKAGETEALPRTPIVQLQELNDKFVPVVHTQNVEPSQTLRTLRLAPVQHSSVPALAAMSPPTTTQAKPHGPIYKAQPLGTPTPPVQQGGKYRPLVPSPLAAQPPGVLKTAAPPFPRYLPFSEPKRVVPRNGHNPRMRHDLRLHPDQMNLTQSNLNFRKVTMEDVAELYTPEAHTEDHRWMVLDLRKDFSHILVPDFSDLVSLDRILKVLGFAHSRQKTVKLQFFSDAQYDAFVTPLSQTKVYFGPLRKDVEPPVIILLQCVDGKMMRREVYQAMHKIQLEPEQTTAAFWLIQNNHRLSLHMEDEVPASPQRARPLANRPVNDDCIVIDDSDDEDVAAPPLAVELNRVNFTIQSTDESRQLQVTSNGRQQVATSGFMPLRATGLPAPKPSLVPIVNKAVITNVTQAPKDANYAATVYIKLPNDSKLQQQHEEPAASVEVEDNDLEFVPADDAAKRPRSASVGAMAMDTINNSLERVSQLFAEPSTEQSEPPAGAKVTILSDVVVPAAENDVSSSTVLKLFDPTDSASTAAQAVKMRRISIRAPASFNNNTKDIALKAVRNMLPAAATSGGKDFVEVVDDLLTISEGQNQQKNEATVLPKKPDKNDKKARAPATPPMVPAVFNIDFADEPSASLVVKPVPNNNTTIKPVLESNLTVKAIPTNNAPPIKPVMEHNTSVQPVSNNNKAVKPVPTNNLPVQPMLNSILPVKPMLDNNLLGKRLLNGTLKPVSLASSRAQTFTVQPTRATQAADISTAHHKLYTLKDVTATKKTVTLPMPNTAPRLSSPQQITSAISKPVISSSPDSTQKSQSNVKTVIVKPKPLGAEDPQSVTAPKRDGEGKTGRMVAEALGVPQFEAKYVNDAYVIQIAATRCVRIKIMDKVEEYLNKFVADRYPECAGKLPTKWNFYSTGRKLKDPATNQIIFRGRPKPPTQQINPPAKPIVASDRVTSTTTNQATNVFRPVMTIKGTTITRLAAPKSVGAVATTTLPLTPNIVGQPQVRVVAPKTFSLSGLRTYRAETPKTTLVQSPKLVPIAMSTAGNTLRPQKYFCQNAAGELVELSPAMSASVASKLKTPPKGTGSTPVRIIKTSGVASKSLISIPSSSGTVRVTVRPMATNVQKPPAAPANNNKNNN